jgi:putative ABC transport system substrate-binding protein
MPVIGYLSVRSLADTEHLVKAFHAGLGETGHAAGRNVAVEYRWANGDYGRLQALAAELVRQSVTVLVATGGQPAALAAKAASANIPIVFATSGDAVRAKLVESYNRPGGNLPGIDILTTSLESKRLGLLRELAPGASQIGYLFNPNYPLAPDQLSETEQAAASLGLRIAPAPANTDDEIDAAFQALSQRHVPALVVAAGPFFDTRREKIVGLAAKHSIPTIYHFREFVAAGGLISYGIDPADAYRQVGVYTGRILRGAKPADLPVLRPTKFELVINLKTAKALSLDIPPTLLARADEVIE